MAQRIYESRKICSGSLRPEMTSKNVRAVRAKPKVAYRTFHPISARRPALLALYVGRKKLFSKKAGKGIANAYGETAQARTRNPNESGTIFTSHPDGVLQDGEHDEDNCIVMANKEILIGLAFHK